MLLSAYEYGYIKVWNPDDDYRLVITLQRNRHSNLIRSLIQLSNGMLVSGSYDKRMIVWNTPTPKYQTWINRFEYCNLHRLINTVNSISSKIDYKKNRKNFKNCHFDYKNFPNIDHDTIPTCLTEVPLFLLLDFANTKIVELRSEIEDMKKYGKNINVSCSEEEIVNQFSLEFSKKNIGYILLSNNITIQPIESQIDFLKSLAIFNSNLKKFNIAKFLLNAKNEFIINSKDYYKIYSSFFNIPNEYLFQQIIRFYSNYLDKNERLFINNDWGQDWTQISMKFEVKPNNYLHAYVDPRLFDKIYYYHKPEELNGLNNLGIHNILSIYSKSETDPKYIWKYCSEVEIEKNSCNFYEKCLDRKLKCDVNDGYPVAFASFYCTKYEEALTRIKGQGDSDYEILSQWVKDVKICLKRKLKQSFDLISDVTYEEIINTYQKGCDYFKNFAFSTHPDCYSESGICNLIKEHKISFLSLINNVFSNMRTAKNIMEDWKLWWDQFLAVIKNCYGKEIEKFVEISNEIEKLGGGFMFLAE